MIQIISLYEFKSPEHKPVYVCDDTSEVKFQGRDFVGLGQMLHPSVEQSGRMNIHVDIDPPFRIRLYDSEIKVALWLLFPAHGEILPMFSEEPFKAMIPESGRGLLLYSLRVPVLKEEAFTPKNRFAALGI
jgi:hypothetical protein